MILRNAVIKWKQKAIDNQNKDEIEEDNKKRENGSKVLHGC